MYHLFFFINISKKIDIIHIIILIKIILQFFYHNIEFYSKHSPPPPLFSFCFPSFFTPFLATNKLYMIWLWTTRIKRFIYLWETDGQGQQLKVKKDITLLFQTNWPARTKRGWQNAGHSMWKRTSHCYSKQTGPGQ